MPGGSDSGKWLECNGQAVDSTAYPKLAVLMSNVPDYQGYFLRGYGNNSAELGVEQTDAIRNITGYFGGDDRMINAGVTGAFRNGGWGKPTGSEGSDNNGWLVCFDASLVVPTANENRPLNKAVRYLIKAK